MNEKLVPIVFHVLNTNMKMKIFHHVWFLKRITRQRLYYALLRNITPYYALSVWSGTRVNTPSLQSCRKMQVVFCDYLQFISEWTSLAPEPKKEGPFPCSDLWCWSRWYLSRDRETRDCGDQRWTSFHLIWSALHFSSKKLGSVSQIQKPVHSRGRVLPCIFLRLSARAEKTGPVLKRGNRGCCCPRIELATVHSRAIQTAKCFQLPFDSYLAIGRMLPLPDPFHHIRL